MYFNQASSHITIDFTVIKNHRFREETKHYLKRRLLSNDLTWGSASNYMSFIPPFLDFIFTLEPDWNNLVMLTRRHIEKYLEKLIKEVKIKQRVTNSRHHIIKSVSAFKKFFRDYKRFIGI